jgi:hypothetical protein
MATALVGMNDYGDACGTYSDSADFSGTMAFVALSQERIR